MTNDTEPRALGAALSAPAFVTRGHGVAMHAANRHVERWAPEADARRVRSMRSLGFVDRLVAPWMETAQRSASMRLLSQYASTGPSEREPGAVSWVFPRPWYQDELDWMAAARKSSTQASAASPARQSPTLLTTRGTYVAPASSEISAPPMVMPSALYEYVAPSLSVAASQRPHVPGVGFGGETQIPSSRGEAYSPLVSLAAVQAAELMSRTVAPLAVQRRGAGATTAMTPGLRAVLTSILERAATPPAHESQPSRLSLSAPELVTPPSPRAPLAAAELGHEQAAASSSATQVAEQYAAQRTRIVELQRIAQQSAQRELAARAETLARSQAAAVPVGEPRAPSVATQPEAIAQAAAAQAAAARAEQATSITEQRSAAERAEAELRQRVGAVRATDALRQADAASASAAVAERARLEERVAQRLAQQTGTQRLHEQARAEAAAHARTPIEPPRRGEPATASTVSRQAPAEVTAAIAGLPPELAAMLGSVVAQHPERAMQAIGELSETLRTAELLARSSASGVAFEATRGPRMMMPAGLGGLVNAVDRAQSITDRPAMLGGQRTLAPLSQFVDQRSQPQLASAQAAQAAYAAQTAYAAQAAQARVARVPALPWLSAAAAHSPSIAPTTALGATTMAAPAALTHVAWADRWLARFAGAAPQSLELITATSGAAPALRMQALANAAPGAVFVAPDFLRGDHSSEQAARASHARAGVLASTALSAPLAGSAPGTAGAANATPGFVPAIPTSAGVPSSVSAVPGMRLINPAPSEPIRRFDDNEETPDDVFTAISAASSRSRARATSPAIAAAAVTAAAEGAAQVRSTVDRQTYADHVAHAAPNAPGAGLSAQLASSPFAPALRHVLPLPSAASFDVRSLFGSGLGATYLAGLLGSASRELSIGAQMAPTWASWDQAPLGQLADSNDRIDRMVPSFDAAYVSPDALAGASGKVESYPALEADASPEARATYEAHIALEARAASEARAALEARGGRPAGEPAGSTPSVADVAAAFATTGDRGAHVPLTTLRTALLSWGVTISDDSTGQPGAAQLAPASFASASYSGAMPTTTARSMIDAMSLPMLGEATPAQEAAWAAPGMVADRAQSWSVAQERSSSDLSLDFVTPELVLAARVYGLGPAEAAQAARLAIAGPGQLGMMASTVDRTFVDAMAIVREARTSDGERRQRISLGAPGEATVGATRDLAMRDLVARSSASSFDVAPASSLDQARAEITTAFPLPGGDIAAAIAPTTRAPAQQPSSGTAFGVDRRAPRGAFLWPQATVAALGMTAAGSDGQLSMSVAALELLAAQVVAEVGTYAALAEADAGARVLAGEAGMAGAVDSTGAAGTVAGATELSSGSSRVAALAAGAPGALLSGRDGKDAAPGSEPGEAEVLGAAAAFVPAARRARFDALYVALSQTAAGRSWSPAARAARALALAGRGDDTVVTARERAASAWDVLPVVYPSEGLSPDAASESTGGAAAATALMASSYVAPGEAGSFGGAGSRAMGGARSAGSQSAGARMRAGSGPRDFASADAGFGVDPDSSARSYVSVSPGLTGLSARAGDALGAYVAPVAAPAAPARERSADRASAGAVLRAPTAAQEYVQTGRSGGRFGGGEVEIPQWFEAAARKMFADKTDSADGISLAELTLVTAAPASHVAASTRAAPSAAPPAPSGASGQTAGAQQIDVDKLANDIYRQILVMMDAARARNGEPYL